MKQEVYEKPEGLLRFTLGRTDRSQQKKKKKKKNKENKTKTRMGPESERWDMKNSRLWEN